MPTVQVLSDAPPDPRAVVELLVLSDERDLWHRISLARELDAYRRGHEDGIAEGKRLEGAERDAAWYAIAGPVARGGPEHAELETKRWGPDGREHFADPRPGDAGPGEAERRATMLWAPYGLPPPGMVRMSAGGPLASAGSLSYTMGIHAPARSSYQPVTKLRGSAILSSSSPYSAKFSSVKTLTRRC